MAGVEGGQTLVSLTAEVEGARYRLSGRVTGCPPEQPRCPSPGGLPGVTVTAAGSAGATTAQTDATGAYAMELDEGAYTVTPALAGSRFEPASRVVDLAGDVSGVDVAAARVFRVTGRVTACPPDARCPDPVTAPDATVTATGSGTATAAVAGGRAANGRADDPRPGRGDVRNRGTRPMHDVTVDPSLVIGYANGARTDALPLRLRGQGTRRAPKPAKLGSLRPGASRRVVLDYEARGDGELDLRALVTYSTQPRSAALTTSGTARLSLRSRALVASTSFPAKLRVRSPVSAGLIRSGTSFAIRVKLENRSLTRPLLVQPLGFAVTGNAHGGKWQPSGLPIQNALAGSGDIAQCECHRVIRLAPRTTQEWDVVFAAWGNDSRARDVRPGARGTRARLGAGSTRGCSRSGTTATGPRPRGSSATRGRSASPTWRWPSRPACSRASRARRRR